MDDISSKKTDTSLTGDCRSAPLDGSARRGRGVARGPSYLTVARSGRYARVKRTKGTKLDIATFDGELVVGTGVSSSGLCQGGATVGSSTSPDLSPERSVTERSTGSSSTTGARRRSPLECTLNQIEVAFIRGGVPAVETVCRRLGVDLSLLDCIAKDEFDAWTPDTIYVAEKNRPA